MKKKAKKKANKNPFRIIIGIILLIKWICFDWIVERLSIKSYHYLVLINYDKTFELSKELVDAICTYPEINYKPRKYHFITKVYYGIKVVSAKSISKINFKSMVSVAIYPELSLNENPLVLIDEGKDRILDSFNSLLIRFENSKVPNFLSYMKDFFEIDYGFIYNCKDNGYLEDTLHDDHNKTWSTDNKKVCEGFLKDVYPVNILNSAHVQNALIDKIKEDERMGEIDSSVDGYLIWNVDSSNIRYARRVCKKMGLLI